MVHINSWKNWAVAWRKNWTNHTECKEKKWNKTFKGGTVVLNEKIILHRIIVTVGVEKVFRVRIQNEVIRGRKGTDIQENIKTIIIEM